MFKVICITGVKRTELTVHPMLLLENPEVYVGDEYTVEEVIEIEEATGYVLAERSPFYLYNSQIFAVCNSGIEEEQLKQKEYARN